MVTYFTQSSWNLLRMFVLITSWMSLTWYNMRSKTRSPAQIKFYFEPKHYGTGQNVFFWLWWIRNFTKWSQKTRSHACISEKPCEHLKGNILPTFTRLRMFLQMVSLQTWFMSGHELGRQLYDCFHNLHGIKN